MDLPIPINRAPKTSPVQWQVLVEYLMNYPEMLTKAFSGVNGRQHYKKMWSEAATQLNSMGYGSKTPDKWIEAFSKWKSKVKVKAQTIKLAMNRTGGGGPVPQLTPIEEKLMGLIGWSAVEGDATEELGLVTQESMEKKGNTRKASGTAIASTSTTAPQSTQVNENIEAQISELPPLVAIGSEETHSQKNCIKRKFIGKINKQNKISKIAMKNDNKTLLMMHEETLKVLKEINENLAIMAKNSGNSKCCCKCQSN
ncbi:uncharacterized protein LOC126738339 [Anthonomus grandis grandis]|uniref:uncharacterized protein LOC126733585 n=1 Tax=Anthonomus grandis grandis TaxID=2921223 RepID=UPI002166AE69|nr:uncharacterized protein LOC126733585 [Anthonomus grandis grandis]XP_050292892.1 uncharacterized protein LOC126733585 [Anthonomus grandis grandis]XP_050299571.1 uncharacterized protein LOC126738339 [Anthonomus grandis grandis]XP_050299572.1 uncharacterized protein LOC126738339 [Anthonomus grandis grandis]